MASFSAETFLCALLFLIGLVFAWMPFSPRLRHFPAWIRLALFSIGVSFLLGSAMGLCTAIIPRSEPELASCLREYRDIAMGAGAGVFLLLVISGELAKAFASSPSRPSP
jgi:hypothetical protein